MIRFRHQRSSTAAGLAVLLLLLAPDAAAQGIASTLDLSNLLVEVDRLAPGTTTGQAVFQVDGVGTEVVFDITANIDTLVTSITGPGGQLIDPSTVGGFAGTFSEFEGVQSGEPTVSMLARPGFHYLYVFEAPAPGTYTVEFDGGAGLAEEVAVVTTLQSSSSLGCVLFATANEVVTGGLVVLGFALFDGDQPVAGANVPVEISGDNGETGNVTLLDDGVGVDQVAGDGIYSGTYSPVAPGNFRATTIATGTAPGIGAFTRMGATSFMAVQPTAIIAGTFSDSGVDTNANGLFELVRVEIDLNVVNPGDHVVQVTLRAMGGPALTANGMASLGMGAASVPVDFTAEAILAAGFDGPFEVEHVEVTLLDGALGPVLVDSAVDLGETLPYLLSQMERDSAILTGQVQDTPFDDNGNGLYDRLVVDVEVDLLEAGAYSWSYKLATQSQAEIEFRADSGNLDMGVQQLRLTFTGSVIGASGANGPYLLTDLLLEGPGGVSLVDTNVGQTAAYTASQFEGGPVPPQPPPGGGDNDSCSCRVEPDGRDNAWQLALLVGALLLLGVRARRTMRV